MGQYIAISWYIKIMIQYRYKFKSHQCIKYRDISMYQYQYIQYCIHNILYSLADALFWINYCALQLSALQLNNFREQKKVMSICQNLLIHTVLYHHYHTIYRCIVILRRQYIDTCKSCIVPPLMETHFHWYQTCMYYTTQLNSHFH